MACYLVIGVGVAIVVIAVLVQYLLDQFYLNMTGRYVLITGCDSGFGNILARYLGQKRRCHVIASCLTKHGMEAIESGAPKGSLTAILMDVTDTQSILRARDEVVKILGGRGLWGLVNNAGVTGKPVPYHWLKRDEIQSILDVNLMGTIQVTNVFFPLIRQARGRIVNLSSATAVLPVMSGGYSISKIGVEAFSDALRLSSQLFGVSVHILEPGYFKTNIFSEDVLIPFVEKMWDRLPKEERDVYGQEYLDGLLDTLKEWLERSSPSLHLVTDAMEHALCARWPWRRYMPGNDIKYFFKPLSLLPAIITDNVLKLLGKMSVAQPNQGIVNQPKVPFAAEKISM